MKHRDFVIYVRNSVEINALVALSQDVFTPATQTEPAFTTEHLTLVYLDPASEAQRMTGDQLRASIKTVFDVAPLVEGAVNGWKEVPNLTGRLSAEESEAALAAKDGSVDDNGNGFIVPMDHMISLSKRIQDHGGDLEVCPDAVVPSACTLIDRLVMDRAAPAAASQADPEDVIAVAKAINAGVELQDSLHPELEAAHRAAAGNLSPGLGSSVEGQPLSGGIVPAEDVVQTDPAIAEAVANPTE